MGNLKFKAVGVVHLLLASAGIKAQSFKGFTSSNWSGVARADVNPASIAGHMYKWDFVLGGVSAYASTDLGYWNKNNTNFKFGDDKLTLAPSQKHSYAFANAEIKLPHLMFSPNSTYTLAIGMRARATGSIHDVTSGVTQSLYQYAQDNGGNGGPYSNQNVSSGAHAWEEIHFTYARVLQRSGTNTIKVGITPKLLLGVGNANFRASSGDFIFQNQDFQLNGFTSELNYSNNLDNNETNKLGLPKRGGTGLGVDLGFEMEYNPNNYSCGFRSRSAKPDVCSGPQYLYRLGVSIVDIGAIKYTNGTNAFVANYNGGEQLNAVSTFGNATTAQSLNDSMGNAATLSNAPATYRATLPARTLIDFDYNLTHGFFVNAQASLNISDVIWTKNRVESPHILTVSPRWEKSTIGVYAPVSLNQYGQVDYGMAFRFGPLVAGVNNIGALLWEKQPQQVGAYVMLKAFQFCRSKSGRVRCPSI